MNTELGGRRQTASPSSAPVSVKTTEKTYPVKGKDFYSAVFGGVDKPLCKQLNIEGCENAVAATSWHLSFVDGSTTLYDAAGNRRQLQPHCDVHMLMPKWVDAAAADNTQQHAVAHFLAHTATHERGHGQACSSLATSILLLAENMPARVPKARVDEFNRAFKGLITLFTTGAREADAEFDKFTSHGGEQDAQLGTRADQKAMPLGKVPTGPPTDFQIAVQQITAPIAHVPVQDSKRRRSRRHARHGGITATPSAAVAATAQSSINDTTQVALPASAHAPTLATFETNFGGIGRSHKSKSSAVQSFHYEQEDDVLQCLDGIAGDILGPYASL